MSGETYDWKGIIRRSRYVDAKAGDGSWNLAVVERPVSSGYTVRVKYDGLKPDYFQVSFLALIDFGI